MDERIRQVLDGEEAWIVGGAVRDELLGRPVVDVDVACHDPKGSAHRFARRFGGVAFPLSERHGAWRVASRRSQETIDFTPLPGGIDDDLATRDFTLNSIAAPVAGGDLHDPYGGQADLRARVVRAVSPSVFRDDPLRLLRAVRLEDELGFRMDEWTQELVRESAGLVVQAAGERILGELVRVSSRGYRRLEALGVLAPLGGSTDGPFETIDDPNFRLVCVFGEALFELPISRELARYARIVLGASPPADASVRAIHRFRRQTEPFALDALAYVRASELAPLVEEARRRDPAEPLVRGDELGLPPGPEIGRILALIEEERVAGEISTREEALALARAAALEGSES